MAFPTFVNAGSFASSQFGIVPGLPSGWAEGDFHILFVETDDEPVTIPDGWNSIFSQAVGASTRLQIAYRWAVNGDTDPSIADAGDHQVGIIHGYRGVNLTTPYTLGTHGANVTGTATAPGINTTLADALVLACYCHSADNDNPFYSNYTNGNLANITERSDNSGSQGTQGNGGGIAVASGEKASVGSTGDSSATLTAAAGWVAVHMALYPEIPFVPKIIAVY